MMKRIAWLFLVVLGTALLVNAQSSTNPVKVSGTVCQSSCVKQVKNVSTCDLTCTDKGGKAVFVDDQGKVSQISNQSICAPFMGKHVTVMAAPTETKAEKALLLNEESIEVTR